MKTPSLTHGLATDHRRLDAILATCKSEAAVARFPAAAEHLASFQSGLARHIEAEESVLFPELERLLPQAGGPTRVMRAEHAELLARVARLDDALRRTDPAWQPQVRELEDLLEGHNLKEERILYPMADHAMSEVAGARALKATLNRVLGSDED